MALAPWKNLAILQVGQFNAPFTLENRISSKYTDFMERSITVRAFGIPDNREMGAMLHGFNDERFFYYSIGTFNGDGQNFKNADNNFDWMGRGLVRAAGAGGRRARSTTSRSAPRSGRASARTRWPRPLRAPRPGSPSSTRRPSRPRRRARRPSQSIQLRQNGRLNAFAVEVNAPIAHKFGLRGEFVWKHSPLSEESIASSGAGTVLGGANLKGYSFYGQALGLADRRRPHRRRSTVRRAASPLRQVRVRRIQNGLVLALRYEHLDETLSEDATAAALNLGNKSVGRTKVDSGELGINYWHSRRYRATFNYVVNHFGGDYAVHHRPAERLRAGVPVPAGRRAF